MMKKLFSVLCILMFCLALVGCNSQKEEIDKENAPAIPQPRTSQVEIKP